MKEAVACCGSFFYYIAIHQLGSGPFAAIPLVLLYHGRDSFCCNWLLLLPGPVYEMVISGSIPVLLSFNLDGSLCAAVGGKTKTQAVN